MTPDTASSFVSYPSLFIEEPFYFFHEIIKKNNRKPEVLRSNKFYIVGKKKGVTLTWNDKAPRRDASQRYNKSADELALCHFTIDPLLSTELDSHFRSKNITPAWKPSVTIFSSLVYVATSVRKCWKVRNPILVSDFSSWLSIVVIYVWRGAGAAVGSCGTNGGTTPWHMTLYSES